MLKNQSLCSHKTLISAAVCDDGGSPLLAMQIYTPERVLLIVGKERVADPVLFTITLPVSFFIHATLGLGFPKDLHTIYNDSSDSTSEGGFVLDHDKIGFVGGSCKGRNNRYKEIHEG